jgi:hypothetical protein
MTCIPSKSCRSAVSFERTLAWITRHRRTVRDYERLPAHHETMIYWAMIAIMARRLARRPPQPLKHELTPWHGR